MGQVGIQSALKSSMRPSLRAALESQLQEYDVIASEARALAASRGWDLPELEPAAKGITYLVTRSRLAFGDTDSKIAGMLIQGNTRGMIVGLKNMHRMPRKDSQVMTLSQRLVDCQAANIRQMQGFL